MLNKMLIVLSILTLPATARSADYCHEKELVLDKEMLWDFRAGFATELNLPTRRGDELVPSMGRVQFGASGDPQLWTTFENSGEGNLGIEYTVYKLEIRIGDEREPDSQLYAEDFSRDCSETGLGIDYGGRRRLSPLKILPKASGEPRGLERVRVRVWGWQ
jgi:hypothetical protein